MYLIDTDVIGEARKGERANAGVKKFFGDIALGNVPIYLSAITIGELRQGVESVRHRGDDAQAKSLERWLNRVAHDYADAILPFDEETAQV